MDNIQIQCPYCYRIDKVIDDTAEDSEDINTHYLVCKHCKKSFTVLVYPSEWCDRKEATIISEHNEVT
jgi:transposase-like protein